MVGVFGSTDIEFSRFSSFELVYDFIPPNACAVSGISVVEELKVRCHAGVAGHLEVTSDSVSVRIGQQICREGKEELWGSLLVECKVEDGGSLAVEVVVFHPDSEESVRIASLQSRPRSLSPAEAALRCDLEQKQV
jgi:hypothetical protein